MSIEVQIDHSLKLDKSIREKSIQSFIDPKLCRLNSGHPKRSNNDKHLSKTTYGCIQAAIKFKENTLESCYNNTVEGA